MKPLALLLGWVLASCLAPALSDSPAPGHRRSVAHARHGMVAASHPLAVQIGLEVLQRGGNAVDAAIATNAALGVLEPHACGIGGDLFALVWDAKTQKLHGLNASGAAPQAATLGTIDRDQQGLIPLHGPHSWSVPGCVDGWAQLHGRLASDLGLLAKEDLAGFRSEWVEPISASYRGVEVFELPPNSQGLAALQMLNILETFDLAKMGRDSVEFWHTMIEAKKLAYEDRARYYADPNFAAVPMSALLAKDYARERASLIDPNRASQQLPPGAIPDHGDTTYLTVVDAEGNMVSLIQSVYWEFGSGYTVGGFALQNRGALFSLDPDSPNVLAPGKRPFHTIIPAFAMKDGKPWLSFGLMGGAMQPQGHAQVLVYMIDFGMDLQQAGDAARFRHMGSSQPTGTQMLKGGEVRVEALVPAVIRQGLEALGHRVRVGGAFGGYQTIARDPVTGLLTGATESRKDGLAFGY